MSKITNDGLTRSGTECFIAVPIWATVGTVGVNGLKTFFLSEYCTQRIRGFGGDYAFYLLTYWLLLLQMTVGGTQ